MLRLDRTSREPLHQQLYRHIRDELISGSFDHDSARLPSSRALADDLGIARLTVKLAFEKLHSEGYLKSKIGSGTFVADSLPETFLSPDKPSPGPQKQRPARFSDRVTELPDQRIGREFDLGIAGAPGVSFVPALAAIDEFLLNHGNVCARRCWRKKARICSSMPRVVATPICAKRSPLISVIFGARVVIPINSSSRQGRSRRCLSARSLCSTVAMSPGSRIPDFTRHAEPSLLPALR